MGTMSEGAFSRVATQQNLVAQPSMPSLEKKKHVYIGQSVLLTEHFGLYIHAFYKVRYFFLQNALLFIFTKCVSWSD